MESESTCLVLGQVSDFGLCDQSVLAHGIFRGPRLLHESPLHSSCQRARVLPIELCVRSMLAESEELREGFE